MIFLAIGSNLPSKFGDRFKNIELAMNYLQKNNISIVKKSSFYETLSYPDKIKPKYGPPKDKGIPSGWPSPQAISTPQSFSPHSPGGLNKAHEAVL